MISSRNLSDLLPEVADKCQAHIDACSAEGIDLLITCTLRDWEQQAALYQLGRTVSGSIVTNAKAGDSAHNYGRAYDVVPMRGGKPVWGTIAGNDAALWERVGELGESVGMEWAGRWTSFKEMAHFQDLGGMTIASLKSEHLAA